MKLIESLTKHELLLSYSSVLCFPLFLSLRDVGVFLNRVDHVGPDQREPSETPAIDSPDCQWWLVQFLLWKFLKTKPIGKNQKGSFIS